MADVDPVDSVGAYPTTDSTYDQWQEYWEGMLQHLSTLLSHHQVFQAVQYAATSVMSLLGNFTEDYQMGGQAKVENVLTQIQNLRNRVQNDFNIQKSGQNDAAAQDALACYYGGTLSDGTTTVGIQNLLYVNRPKEEGGTGMFTDDYIQGVEQEFNVDGSDSGSIFHGNTKSQYDALANYWAGLWSNEDTDKPDSTQAVTNGLTAVSSDFSSQSSTTQSKIKYYEANDEQWKSMMHDIMSEYINEEKQSTTAMQSASS